MPRQLLAIFLLLFACSAAATELEPKTIGPTPGNVSFVSSAYSGGKFLTVWRQLFMPYTGIWGAFSDASGKPLGPSFPIVPSTNAQHLNLFPNGEGFVLVWDDANRSSQLCQIDNKGSVTGQKTIGPPGLISAFATRDRILFTRSGGGGIVDFDGGSIRTGLASAQYVAAGRDSFFGVTSGSDLMLTRYSADGQFAQQLVLERDSCRTLANCWFVTAARELDSGSVLVVVANNDHRIETLMLAPDGSVSAPNAITTTLPELWRARIQQSGTHLWLFLAGGKGGGATRVEATELDATGAATAPVTTIIDTLAGQTEVLTFAEGAGLVFAATSPTTADRQVQTFAFRSLAPVAPEVVSTTPSIQADAQITSNGSGFLAMWKDTNGTRGARSHWAAVDASGRRIGPVFEGEGNVVRKSLVSNGLDYVVLVTSNHLIARRLASDGTILGDTPISDASSICAVVATSNVYVIVWAVNQTMYSTTLTFNGVAGPAHAIAPSVTSTPGRIPRWISPVMAWDGSAVLLAAGYAEDLFTVGLGPPDTILTSYAMLLTSDGALVAGSETALEPAFVLPSSAASGGREFLVAGAELALGYRDGSRLHFIYRRLIDINSADVVWSGRLYLVARSVQGTTLVTPVQRDGAIGGTAFLRGPEDVDVSADATGRVVIAGVESNGAGPFRAVAYSASELQPLQQPLPSTGRSRAVAH